MQIIYCDYARNTQTVIRCTSIRPYKRQVVDKPDSAANDRACQQDNELRSLRQRSRQTEKTSLLPDYYAVSDTSLSYQGKDRKAAMQMSSNGKPQERIAVINIRGALTKYDQFSGSYGLMSHTQQIEQAYNDNSITAIVLDMDTPGGSVVGTEIAAQMVGRKDKP